MYFYIDPYRQWTSLKIFEQPLPLTLKRWNGWTRRLEKQLEERFKRVQTLLPKILSKPILFFLIPSCSIITAALSQVELRTVRRNSLKYLLIGLISFKTYITRDNKLRPDPKLRILSVMVISYFCHFSLYLTYSMSYISFITDLKIITVILLVLLPDVI